MQEDYINPTADGNLSWRCVGVQNRLHKVSMRRCARVIRSVRWLENESRELPTYEGFIYTLAMILRTWYTSMEPQQGTQYWGSFVKQFAHTFELADEHPAINTAL